MRVYACVYVLMFFATSTFAHMVIEFVCGSSQVWKILREHLAAFGNLLHHLTIFGSVWKHLEALGSIWEYLNHLGAFGSIRDWYSEVKVSR